MEFVNMKRNQRTVEVESVKMVSSAQMRIVINIKLAVLPIKNNVLLLCKVVQVTRGIKILVWDF